MHITAAAETLHNRKMNVAAELQNDRRRRRPQIVKGVWIRAPRLLHKLEGQEAGLREIFAKLVHRRRPLLLLNFWEIYMATREGMELNVGAI
jgi:hypothetical protein